MVNYPDEFKGLHATQRAYKKWSKRTSANDQQYE